MELPSIRNRLEKDAPSLPTATAYSNPYANNNISINGKIATATTATPLNTNNHSTIEGSGGNKLLFNKIDSSSDHDDKKIRVINPYHYRYDLLFAISPLIIILLLFGGHLSILALSFGCLLCYIFDLVDFVEVSVSLYYAVASRTTGA